MPMNYFTPNEVKPSEKTLQLIRQIARLCHVKDGKYNMCMN
jgi:hypothetical protein